MSKKINVLNVEQNVKTQISTLYRESSWPPFERGRNFLIFGKEFFVDRKAKQIEGGRQPLHTYIHLASAVLSDRGP